MRAVIFGVYLLAVANVKNANNNANSSSAYSAPNENDGFG
jgi:hypothetical protein